MQALTRQLKLAVFLGTHAGHWPAHILGDLYGVTTMTIKRDIKELVHLGAEIDSSHLGYCVMNWEKIDHTTRRWLELEESRTDGNCLRRKIFADRPRDMRKWLSPITP